MRGDNRRQCEPKRRRGCAGGVSDERGEPTFEFDTGAQHDDVALERCQPEQGRQAAESEPLVGDDRVRRVLLDRYALQQRADPIEVADQVALVGIPP